MKCRFQCLAYMARLLLERCVIILGVKSRAIPVLKGEEAWHSFLPKSSIILNNELAKVLHTTLGVPLYLPILLCSKIVHFTPAKRPHWS